MLLFSRNAKDVGLLYNKYRRAVNYEGNSLEIFHSAGERVDDVFNGVPRNINERLFSSLVTTIIRYENFLTNFITARKLTRWGGQKKRKKGRKKNRATLRTRERAMKFYRVSPFVIWQRNNGNLNKVFLLHAKLNRSTDAKLPGKSSSFASLQFCFSGKLFSQWNDTLVNFCLNRGNSLSSVLLSLSLSLSLFSFPL